MPTVLRSGPYRFFFYAADGEHQHDSLERRLIGNGRGIHWPDLDEDISVENLLAGKPSFESQTSLKRWLHERHGNKREN